LSKRIIISGRERILKPFISFTMSLFITGAGEIYSGSPQRGITLVLIRGVSFLAVPFYSMTNIKNSYLTEVFFALLFFAIITLFSPFHALIIAIKKKKIVVSRLSSGKFIVLFITCNLIITFISIAVFISFFSFKQITQNYPPIIEIGDIAVIKKSEKLTCKKGEMIVLRDENSSLIRIIGIPGETISYDNGRFSAGGSELFLSIFTENDLKKFSLTDFDVISETQGEFKYPVIQNRDKYKLNIVLSSEHYFAAPDDRNDLAGFAAVKNNNIYGRLEGLLFSLKRVKFLIKPFRSSE